MNEQERKVIEQALEALKFGLHVGFDESSESQIKKGGKAFDQHNKAITALRQCLEQEEKQEHVVFTYQGVADTMNALWRGDFTQKAIAQEMSNRPLYPAPPKREPLTEWEPIETAPKDTEVILYCNKFIPLYIGKKRYGCLGEPQQDEFEWRCSGSGRFANPTYWMPLPKPPIEARIKEKNT